MTDPQRVMQSGRRHGVFGGVPRLAYARWPASYLDGCSVVIVLHGLAVAIFGLAVLALYVDLTGAELATFAACLTGGYVLEGLVAGWRFRVLGHPAGAWAAGQGPPIPDAESAQHAWSCAAQLPVALLRRPSLALLGLTGSVAASLTLAAVLHLPPRDAAWVLPLTLLLYLSSMVLRYIGLELAMRPVLEAIGASLPAPMIRRSRISLHLRLVATVPTVTWATGVIVGGLLTDNTRRLDTIGQATLIALGVAIVVSTWLSLVLADAVSGPIIDLRNATLKVAAGDLSARVPVVSTDETGELAESFNAMVVGLGERERLREAFGAFVDPALTERVLEEGSDLPGQEVDVSILFLDVRDFTAFAESTPPQAVVAALNSLYDLVVPVVIGHGGHANRFLGDGLLAVFGAPERRHDHATRAVEAALEITEIMRHRLDQVLRIGIGVNSGRVVAGTIGGGGRRDFTIIGDPVNTAARVEAATRETGDDLLITEATWHALSVEQRHAFVERPTAPLKGKSGQVRVYAPHRPSVVPSSSP